jgi:hypothetical protein
MSDTNATLWTDVAIRTLAFADRRREIEQWRVDNARYLKRIEEVYPHLHARIEEAAAQAGAGLAP